MSSLLHMATNQCIEAREADTLNAGLYKDPTTMDPHTFISTTDWGLIHLAYEGILLIYLRGRSRNNAFNG